MLRIISLSSSICFRVVGFSPAIGRLPRWAFLVIYIQMLDSGGVQPSEVVAEMARKPGDACEASLFSSGRLIVGSSCNARNNAFTSSFISTAIRHEHSNGVLPSIPAAKSGLSSALSDAS